MARRSDHTREQLREMALSQAEAVIVRDGIGALSMRKIAKAMGYTVGTLYLIFPNQDALLLAVNLRTADALHGHLLDAIAAADSKDELRAAASAYIDFAQANPHRWRLVFELNTDQPDQATQVQRRVEQLFALIESLLAARQHALDSAALRQTAAALWAGVHGMASLHVTGKLDWAGTHQAAGMLDVLLDKLAPDTATD